MADRAKHLTLQPEFGQRCLDGEIPAREYPPDEKRIHAHRTLIGSWKEQDIAGQPSRNARERVRTFLLAEENRILPTE